MSEACFQTHDEQHILVDTDQSFRSVGFYFIFYIILVLFRVLSKGMYPLYVL